jgi:2,3-diaminopropionate biosynthesis protein SbnB
MKNQNIENWRASEQPLYVSAEAIASIISGSRSRIIDIVAQTYQSFYDKDCINPDTYSLKFPFKPKSRINALPAYVGGDVDLAGIKWVASFPDNVKKNKQRASAVIIINSFDTGYPLALLDGTLISSARTAASAALAARLIKPNKTSELFTLYGAGVINRDVVNFLIDDGWELSRVQVNDFNPESKVALEDFCRNKGTQIEHASMDASATSSDLISMATSALEPWYDFEIERHQTILHISLRDILPHRLGQNVRNIVDDIDHAVKANTSLELLQREAGKIPQIENYRSLLAREPFEQGATVVSAFGMGMLDVALASFVMDEAAKREEIREISGLLPVLGRW